MQICVVEIWRCNIVVCTKAEPLRGGERVVMRAVVRKYCGGRGGGELSFARALGRRSLSHSRSDSLQLKTLPRQLLQKIASKSRRLRLCLGAWVLGCSMILFEVTQHTWPAVDLCPIVPQGCGNYREILARASIKGIATSTRGS